MNAPSPDIFLLNMAISISALNYHQVGVDNAICRLLRTCAKLLRMVQHKETESELAQAPAERHGCCKGHCAYSRGTL